VKILVKYLEYRLSLEGVVINRAESSNALVDLSMVEKKGYDDFYKYRKKYKALESLTKKL